MAAAYINQPGNQVRAGWQAQQVNGFVKDLSTFAIGEQLGRHRFETRTAEVESYPRVYSGKPTQYIISFGDERIIKIENNGMYSPRFSHR